MRQIAKKIHISILLFALTLFNAHLAIPHDHHQSVDGLCTSNIINTNHHPVFPAHCHAFNDLVLDKAVVLNHFQTFHFIKALITEMQDPNLTDFLVSFNEDSEQPVHFRPSELFLLRAPPSLLLVASC